MCFRLYRVNANYAGFSFGCVKVCQEKAVIVSKSTEIYLLQKKEDLCTIYLKISKYIYKFYLFFYSFI